MSRDTLGDLARSLTGPFAFCGLAMSRGGRDYITVSTAKGISATDRTLFRVASVSKIIVGWTARMALARLGGHAQNQGDIAVEAVLGFPLRHPLAPGAPITVGQLASHSSGLTDTAGYLVPQGVTLAQWIERQGSRLWSAHAPGTHFSYSNLGYLLLAAVAEVAAQERFDRLTRQFVLDPLNVEGGFNWSGVLSERRHDRLPIFRRDAMGFQAQIDDEVAPGGISGPDGRQIVMPAYQLGNDVARLSPQGGLRLSMQGLLALAKALPKGPMRRLWSKDMGTGDYLTGTFDGYGWGQQFLDTPTFYPRPLIGHFGNAYGFCGGVWWDSLTGTAFSYALNGLEIGDDSDVMSDVELRIFEAFANLSGVPT